MRTLLLALIVAATSSLMTGCATNDTDQFYSRSPTSGCETGTGGTGQPPCKMVYWSSRDGQVDPHEPDSKGRDDRR